MSPSFADLGVPNDLVALLARRSITEPSAIQAATIPDALAGHDVCGRAPTGSGKTLAFGLALCINVEKGRRGRPRALVLAPTRELALQIADEIEPLARKRDRRVLAVYGGAGYGPQRDMLRSGVDILVATPGRLEDLIQRGDCKLDEVQVVVLDEADRMADMGFMPSVKRLLDATRSDRQTLLFSATLDGAIDGLVKQYQHKPRKHDVAAHIEQPPVHHRFLEVSREGRVAVLAGVIAQHGQAIVFCRTKHGADRLARQLHQSGVTAVPIHGNRSQSQRERALDDFKRGRAQALVATDVAARGIHVDAVPCVIHFDPPEDPKDFLHRSGRTGRAGEAGTVLTLVMRENAKAVKALQRELGLHMPFENEKTVSEHAAKHAPKGGPITSPRPSPTQPRTPRPNRAGGSAAAAKASRERRRTHRGTSVAAPSGGRPRQRKR
ncbi:MAG: hypothetical protein QOE63_6 [Acidimicrobiaceae bacterium]